MGILCLSATLWFFIAPPLIMRALRKRKMRIRMNDALDWARQYYPRSDLASKAVDLICVINEVLPQLAISDLQPESRLIEDLGLSEWYLRAIRHRLAELTKRPLKFEGWMELETVDQWIQHLNQPD